MIAWPLWAGDASVKSVWRCSHQHMTELTAVACARRSLSHPERWDQ